MDDNEQEVLARALGAVKLGEVQLSNVTLSKVK